MEDDWDLHAVVRGCAATLTTTNTNTNTNINTTTTTTNNSTNNNPFFHHSSYLPNFYNYGEYHNSFDHLIINHDMNDVMDPFFNLQEFYFDVPRSQPINTAPVMTAAIQVLQQPNHEVVNIVQQVLPPHEMNFVQNSQENIVEFNNIPANNSQPIRARRSRKNQPVKMIRQMTQEELSADAWAWRKYGQKPIKGSAYPRNYYRCSTSKGCAARKHVERNSTDPVTFVVAYCGEHTHPRPTHRSSLAGTTRSKVTLTGGAAAKNNTTQKDSNSSSPSGSGFSPDTPLAEGVEEDEENYNLMMNDDDDDDDDEDVFKGCQDFDNSSGGGATFNG
ncbi:hypothetical protein ACJIZ3_009045 [Penstemon smallii]|uniref:WRKY domain-containing protein n=1 Tax=Penstemon smallii TaxID=265156 RepID=A0ABD3TBF1_9LAMI